jgi:hypothetical protein
MSNERFDSVRDVFGFADIIELKKYNLKKNNIAEQKTDNRRKSRKTRPPPE